MKKKSPLKPARTRTTRSKAPKARKMTPKEALKLGRTTRAERKAWRRKMQKRRIAQRQRDKKKAILLARRFKRPGWTLPPEPPSLYGPNTGPYVPKAEELDVPDDGLGIGPRPPKRKPLTARQRQRQMVMEIKSALERDREWVQANRDNPYPDCRLKAAGICEGGLGRRERGLLCPRCVEDLGSGSVDGLVRDAIIRHVMGKPQPQRPRGPQRAGESARSWRSSGERNPTGLIGPGFLDEEF